MEELRYLESVRDRLEALPLAKELARRRDSNLEVFLRWHKKANVLSIMMTELPKGNSYNFIVPNDKGLEAFYHPYPFAYREGIMFEREYNDGA